MPGTALVALDGVLRGPHGQPLTEGVALYYALSHVYRLVVLTDDDDKPADDHWLKVEGLREHVEVISPGQVALRGDGVRERQLAYCRGRGMTVALLLDASPANIAVAVRHGVAGVLFTQPRYARPEFRPDSSRGARAWGELAAELEAQAEMHTSDYRLGTDPEAAV